MATIAILLQREALIRVEIPLAEDEVQKRFIYGFPEFIRWLEKDLPALQRGRLRAADPPSEQVDNLLYRWIAGLEIDLSTQFHVLWPLDDDVWEMKTPDVRIFGWMYQRLRFIAVFGDYADHYKPDPRTRRARRSYEDAKWRVIDARNRLDLNPPKLVRGAPDDLIRV